MLYVLVAIGLTLAVLIAGLVIMAIGGKLDTKFSTKLMSLRVVFQGIAIILIAISYYLTKK